MTALPRTIGILGGMGPAATVLMMQRLIASVPGVDDRDHIPLLVDSNTQVPSRVDALIHQTGPDPAPVLVKMAQRLQMAGAEALAMPCNTAHHYAAQIRAAVEIPFIDMVTLSATAAARRTGEGKMIGILGSPALRRIGHFDRALAEVGLATLYPAEEAPLLGAIRAIKAGETTTAAMQSVEAAAEGLTEAGAALCLVACTEFSVVAPRLTARVPLIDTLDVLVEAVRDFALADQAGPVRSLARG